MSEQDEPPAATHTSRRRVVNQPTARIRLLLDAIGEWEAWYEQVATDLATHAPEYFEHMPAPPKPDVVVHERMYQQIRGKDIERSRTNMRLHRMRKAQGLYVPKTKGWREREDKAVKEVSEALGLTEATPIEPSKDVEILSPRIDNQYIGTDAPVAETDITGLVDELKSLPEPDLSKFTDEELKQMGLKR